MSTGRGTERNDDRAAKLYDKACKGGNGLGCNNLGAFYKDGRGGLDRDRGRAEELYRKGCNLGNQLGCKNLRELEEGDDP